MSQIQPQMINYMMSLFTEEAVRERLMIQSLVKALAALAYCLVIILMHAMMSLRRLLAWFRPADTRLAQLSFSFADN